MMSTIVASRIRVLDPLALPQLSRSVPNPACQLETIQRQQVVAAVVDGVPVVSPPLPAESKNWKWPDNFWKKAARV